MKKIYLFYKYIFSKIFFKSFNNIYEIKNKLVYDLYHADQIKLCYSYFKKFFNKAIFFSDEKKLLEFSCSCAIDLFKEIKISKKNINLDDYLFLEFGVYKGCSIDIISQFSKVYGFDSFYGLPEDWKDGFLDHTKGTYSTNGVFKTNNKKVVIIKGLVEDTLKKFLKINKKIIFIHLDLDIYSSSKFVLSNLKKHINKDGLIIHLGQIYNYTGWQKGEFKAFKEEIMQDKNLRFIFLGFNKNHTSATVKVFRI
jgi:hypothetical protein